MGGEHSELYEAIIAANSCSDAPTKAHFLTSVLNELNEDHKFLFGRILDLLAYIVDPANQSHNKMSIQNISTCLGPNLLYKSNTSDQIDVMGTATANSVIYNILSSGIYFNPPQAEFQNPDTTFTNNYLFISLAKAIYPFSSENAQELSFKVLFLVFFICNVVGRRNHIGYF